jgi:hypothetical protein
MSIRTITTILCALVLLAGPALLAASLATSGAANAQACPNHRCPQ